MSSIPRNTFFSVFGSGEAPGVEGQQYAGRDDRRVLLSLCRAFQPRHVVEIGVQRGITARLLLANCPWIQSYTGVDVPPGFAPAMDGQQPEVPAIAGELARHDPRFRLLLHPRGTAGLGPFDLPVADLVYIDADHSYPGVMRDTGLARKTVRPLGGVIVWHDYGNDTVEVTAAIDQLNRTTGDRIVHVEDTWICFEIRGLLDGRAAAGQETP